MSRRAPLSEESIRKLREIEALILSEPEHYDQNAWARRSPCGTVCCIAGHAIAMGLRESGMTRVGPVAIAERAANIDSAHGDEYLYYSMFVVAGAHVLGLDVGDANRLFNEAIWWPAPFGEDYLRAKNAQARACVAVRRIEHFIESGE